MTLPPNTASPNRRTAGWRHPRSEHYALLPEKPGQNTISNTCRSQNRLRPPQPDTGRPRGISGLLRAGVRFHRKRTTWSAWCWTCASTAAATATKQAHRDRHHPHRKISQVGKLFVIIGRRTFSACQNLVNNWTTSTNAIFVGEPTAENINFCGDTNPWIAPTAKPRLPGPSPGGGTSPQWENGDWLAPTFAVDMSFDDYRSNRDPCWTPPQTPAMTSSSTPWATSPGCFLTDLMVWKIPVEILGMLKDPTASSTLKRSSTTPTTNMNRNQVESAVRFPAQHPALPDPPMPADSRGQPNWRIIPKRSGWTWESTGRMLQGGEGEGWLDG